MTIKLTLSTILGPLALMLVGTSSVSLLQAWQAHSLASYIEAVSTADVLLLGAPTAARSDRGGMRPALLGADPRAPRAPRESPETHATSDTPLPSANEDT